jgi:hypothetical protein
VKSIPTAVAIFFGITIGAFLFLAMLLGLMGGLVVAFDYLFGDLKYPFNVIMVVGSSTAVLVGILGTIVHLFPAKGNTASGPKP